MFSYLCYNLKFFSSFNIRMVRKLNLFWIFFEFKFSNFKYITPSTDGLKLAFVIFDNHNQRNEAIWKLWHVSKFIKTSSALYCEMILKPNAVVLFISNTNVFNIHMPIPQFIILKNQTKNNSGIHIYIRTL